MPKISNQNVYVTRATAARRGAESSTDDQVRESRLDCTAQDAVLAEPRPQEIDPARARHGPLATDHDANQDHPPPPDVIALMLADAMPQMLWSARADGFPDYFNDHWYAVTGVPEGSSDGSGWNDVLHVDDRKRAGALWRSSVETGNPF
ncbi:MAG: hypothetical protein H7312_24300, partial [Tardiphaga sp.]|nr:hypothetical protein [Tardiphaga sp.]